MPDEFIEMPGPIPPADAPATVGAGGTLELASTEAPAPAADAPLQPGNGGAVASTASIEPPDLFGVLIPQPVEAEGYIPTNLVLTLSGEQARTLARVRKGMVAAGAIPEGGGTEAALRHLLDIIGRAIDGKHT